LLIELEDKELKFFKKILKNNNLNEQKQISDEVQRWNRFINEICFKEHSKLTPTQKAAVLTFWYDAEMNSGGHSGYFDCYTEVNSEDLIWALTEVGGSEYINNYKEAIQIGQEDGYLKTDNVFYNITPSLSSLLMEYVEKHSSDIFASL
jgi:hypothetical protein